MFHFRTVSVVFLIHQHIHTNTHNRCYCTRLDGECLPWTTTVGWGPPLCLLACLLRLYSTIITSNTVLHKFCLSRNVWATRFLWRKSGFPHRNLVTSTMGQAIPTNFDDGDAGWWWWRGVTLCNITFTSAEPEPLFAVVELFFFCWSDCKPYEVSKKEFITTKNHNILITRWAKFTLPI